MPRFRLQVHDRAKSFVLRLYTMHELRNQHVSMGQFLRTESRTFVFFCTVKAKKSEQKPKTNKLDKTNNLNYVLHGTIFLFVTLFETNKTVSPDLFFPSCHYRKLLTLIIPVLSTAKNANHFLSSGKILQQFGFRQQCINSTVKPDPNAAPFMHRT